MPNNPPPPPPHPTPHTSTLPVWLSEEMSSSNRQCHKTDCHAGANLIPLQIFHSQNSEAGYRLLLEDVVEANMNMLRIWGGGLYQDDSLYDLADEMGILIWQEAMFACAQYPRDNAFLDNVSLLSDCNHLVYRHSKFF